MKGFNVLLAEEAPDDLSTLPYPMFASRKLDGIRCVKIGGKALTRNLKPIGNDYIREWVEENLPDGIDGEIMLTDHRTPLNLVSGAVRRKSGVPDFRFHAFDYFHECAAGYEFKDRYDCLRELVEERFSVRRLVLVDQDTVDGPATLDLVIGQHLEEGYEGTMLRRKDGPYKHGRSTQAEAILLKVKPWIDEEGVIVGFEAEQHNTNEATTSETGRTKRSSAKAGKVAKDMLGRIFVHFDDGVVTSVGGFTKEQKYALWENPEALLGQVVTVKHQKPPGGKRPAGTAPRHPQFKAFRNEPI